MPSNHTNPLVDEKAGDHAILSLRYDTKPVLRDLREALDCTPTGAAIAVSLTREADGAARNTSVSFCKEHYPSGSPLYTYTKVTSATKTFAEDGLVDLWMQLPGVRKMQSVMRPTAKLLDIVRPILASAPRLRVIQPRDTVIVRRDGVNMPAPDTQYFNRQRKRIGRWNGGLAAAGLSLGDSSLRRIFVGDTEHCGRLIADGGAWQNVEREVRRRATLNGKPMREFDFSTTHPSILYATVGLVPPADSYDVDGVPRKIAKAAFNTLLNASEYWEAVGAVANSKAMLKYGPFEEHLRMRLARKAISEIKRKHRPILKFFLSGSGMWLMFVESEIAMDVHDMAHKDGQVTFGLHDGHLVEASYGERVAEHMLAAAAARGFPLMTVEEKFAKATGLATNEYQSNQRRSSEKDYMGEWVGGGGGCLPASSSSAGGSDSSTVVSAASRRGGAEALRTEAEGRSPSPESSASVSDAAAEALPFDSALDPSEDATPVEFTTGSLDVEPQSTSPVCALSSPPWDRSSILAALELRRHDRAVAAAMSVAGTEASTDLDWSSQIGFGLAQSTNRGSTWTWSLPGRRVCVVYLWNGAESDAVIPVADRAAAGRVVEAYLRFLSGDGPRLRIDVTYAGRYDLGLTPEENVVLYQPVTDVLRRPSLVPGAPDVEDDEEPPFVTDEPWFDDEVLPLAA